MIGYVAKDKDGEIYLHTEEPIYDDDSGCWFSSPEEVCITGQFSEFDNMSYTDEPVEVEISLKRV